MKIVQGLLFVVSLACASGPNPESTLDAYSDALRRDDPVAAYALLSRETRESLTLGEFTAQWRAMKPERESQLRELASARTVALEAHLRAGAATLELRDRGEGWRVEKSPWLGENLQTPEAVMRALVRAVERRDVDAFTRLLSESKREKIQRALKNRLQALKSALARPVEVQGDRVVVNYDPEHRLWLVREDGGWRVDDLE